MEAYELMKNYTWNSTEQSNLYLYFLAVVSFFISPYRLHFRKKARKKKGTGWFLNQCGRPCSPYKFLFLVRDRGRIYPHWPHSYASGTQNGAKSGQG